MFKQSFTGLLNDCLDRPFKDFSQGLLKAFYRSFECFLKDLFEQGPDQTTSSDPAGPLALAVIWLSGPKGSKGPQ